MIPDIDPRKGPSSGDAPDPHCWPSMKKVTPNAIQASKGKDCSTSTHFHLAKKIVYFVHWQFFYGELVPLIKCPKCNSVDPLCSDGWVGVNDKIRRVCSADGPAFLYSKVYRCGNKDQGCPGKHFELVVNFFSSLKEV